MDMAELHINACLGRNESRGNYIRMDCPETDPDRENMLTFQRMENGQPIIEIKEVADLRPEYCEKGE